MTATREIRCALWFQSHGTGPNANKTGYFRSDGLEAEPLISSRQVQVTGVYEVETANETYFSLDVSSAASNLVQGSLGLGAQGEASVGFVTGYISYFEADDPSNTQFIFFPNRGAAYVLPGPTLAIRLELVGPKRVIRT